MNKIFLFLYSLTLLLSTGCVFWRGHDRAGGSDRRQHDAMVDHSRSVDHGEFPGDRNHDLNR